MPRKRQRKRITQQCVAVYGLMAGEVAYVASGRSFKGSRICVTRGMVPPLRTTMPDDVKEQDDFFMAMHARVRGRPGMNTVAETRAWWMATAVGEGDDEKPYVSMDQLHDLELEVQALAGEKIQKDTVISSEALAKLVGSTSSPSDILDAFTKKGIQLLHLNYWYLDRDHLVDEQQPELPVLSFGDSVREGVARGDVQSFQRDQRARFRMAKDDLRGDASAVYMLCSTTDPWQGTAQQLIAAAMEADPDVDGAENDYVTLADDDMRAVCGTINLLDMATLKAALVSIVRKSASVSGVLCSDGERRSVSNSTLIKTIVAHMLTKHSYMPYTGTMESGIQAVLRELLAICICEAWPMIQFEVNGLADVSKMLAWVAVAATYARFVPRWMPSKATLLELIDIAEKAWVSRGRLLVTPSDPKKKPPPVVAQPAPGVMPNTLGWVSYLMDSFLMMPADERLAAREAAWRESQPSMHAHRFTLVHDSEFPNLAPVPLEVALAPRCAPELVYCMTRGGVLDQMVSEVGKHRCHPTRPIFEATERLVTGVNVRRPQINSAAETILDLVSRKNSDKKIVAEVLGVQTELWRLRVLPRPRLTVTDDTPMVGFPLQRSLAQMAHAMGLIEFECAGRKWHFTLNINNPEQLSLAAKVENADLRPLGTVGDRDHPTVAQQMQEQQDAATYLYDTLLAPERGVVVPGLGGRVLRYECPPNADDGDDDDGERHLTLDHQLLHRARDYTVRAPSDTLIGKQLGDCYFAPVLGVDHAQFVTRLRAELAALGATLSKAGIQLAISLLTSGALRLALPVPAQDGGVERTKGSLCTRAYLEAAQVLRTVASMSTTLLRAVSPTCFETAPQYGALRAALVRRANNEMLMTVPPSQRLKHLDTAVRWFTAQTNNNLHPQQRQVLDIVTTRLVRDHHHSHYVWLDYGGGKTFTALLYAYVLQLLYYVPAGEVPARLCVVFITSASALDTVIQDAKKMGLSHTVIKGYDDAASISDDFNFQVVFATHDTAKTAGASAMLSRIVSDGLLVVDEAHLCVSGARLRNGSVDHLARVARDTLFMTATPMLSPRNRKAFVTLLQHVVDFPITNTREIFIASTAFAYSPLDDNVSVEHHDCSAVIDSNRDWLVELLPRSMGGSSQAASASVDVCMQSLQRSLQACDKHIVARVKEDIAQGKRPFVVTRNHVHTMAFVTELIKAGVPEAQIWHQQNAGQSPRFGELTTTPRSQHLRVAVMAIRQSTGYSATHFNVRYRAVFPSNNHDRMQIDGRLARYGQLVRPVHMNTVHAGITSLLLNRHLEATTMQAVMTQLNTEFADEPMATD